MLAGFSARSGVASSLGRTSTRLSIDADLVFELMGNWYLMTPRTCNSNGCLGTRSHLPEPHSSVLLPGFARRTSPTDEVDLPRRGEGSNTSGESKSKIS